MESARLESPRPQSRCVVYSGRTPADTLTRLLRAWLTVVAYAGFPLAVAGIRVVIAQVEA